MKEAIGDLQRLHHIVEAINEILNYTSGADFDIFCNNSMMRFATVKQIEIIGEAVYHLSKELKSKHSDIEWDQIAGMRHILVHEYYGVAPKLVWQVVNADLPVLKKEVEKMIQSFS
jgi:uncharacterized protein with HEPN domain